MSAPGVPDRQGAADWRYQFVENMASLEFVYGAAPRATMRILGWMLVCKPAEQTAPDIQEELELSAGSVSTAVRFLTGMGMLERVDHRGDRRIFYRSSKLGWQRVLQNRTRAFTELKAVAEHAIDAAGGEADDRLVEMRDTYALMEAGVRELLRVMGGEVNEKDAPADTLPTVGDT
jgi:DNA-binding transcriptional regulator GbsR (MarR family)